VPARTRFSCLATVDAGPAADPRYRLRYSLVEAWPESGRLHQIRRHLKHASHPIIGDVRYGKREHNEICRTRFGLGRLALHATSLSFDDPRNGIERTIDAAVPRDLGEPLAAMGLR
jgi:tRNA pseudouridine65 synthase